MITAFCLDCEREIDLGREPQVSQKIVCPYCQTKLEIINVEPIELDWIYEGPGENIRHMRLFTQDWQEVTW